MQLCKYIKALVKEKHTTKLINNQSQFYGKVKLKKTIYAKIEKLWDLHHMALHFPIHSIAIKDKKLTFYLNCVGSNYNYNYS